MEDIDTISRYYKIVFGYVFSLCGNRELTEVYRAGYVCKGNPA